jgi:putative DNA primase/helicase
MITKPPKQQPPVEEKKPNIQSSRERIRAFLSDSANAPTVLDSEGANAWRIAQHHLRELVFVEGLGWFVNDGTCWRSSTLAARKIASWVSRYVRDEARQKYREASLETDEDKRKALFKDAERLLKWCGVSEQSATVKGSLSQAEILLAVGINELDQHDHLLNVLNGTIDLKTGVIHPHDPDDLITCCAPIAYNPDAKAPVWERFLEQIMPNRAMRRYLQKAIGYSLSGSVKEQAVFLLYGRGSNGKSTFLNIIVKLLGDVYAKRTAPELLMTSGGIDRHPTEVADLKGTRFAFTSETEAGRRFATGRLKELTGETLIKARYMRQDFFTFPITFKLWLAVNDKPVVEDNSRGFWRRIKLIPFTQTFDGESKDDQLLEKLAEELPGILNWALKGYRLWQEEGLKETPEMLESLDDYRQEMDSIGQFIDNTCVIGDPILHRTRAGELYEGYRAWCLANKCVAQTNANFKNELEERGFPQVRLRGRQYYSGIRLIQEHEAAQAA